MSKNDTSVKQTEKILLKLLGKVPILPRTRKVKARCEHCGLLTTRLDRHHITYEPEVIAKLCRPCHKNITSRNTKASRLLGHALSNVERVKIWARFIKKTERVSPLPMSVHDGADTQRPASSLSLKTTRGMLGYKAPSAAFAA